MSQVGHMVAVQYERAIGRVYRSLRISVLIRFSELAVLTVKFVSTAGWTTSGRLIDSVQRRLLQKSLIKSRWKLSASNPVVFDELMQFFTVSLIAEGRCSLIS
jgi:hypothetical protein